MSATPDNPRDELNRLLGPDNPTIELERLLLGSPAPLELTALTMEWESRALLDRYAAIERYYADEQAEPVGELRKEIADLKALLRPAEPPPPDPGQAVAPLPGSGPIPRRERLARIMEALRELDPDLDPAAMPGTKADLLELCKAADTRPKQFSISLRTFDNCITGWLQFAGRKPGITDYYRNRLPALLKKLA